MAAKKWSLDITVKFLELYEQHSCLWNIHSPSYKDRNARDAALEDIANTMKEHVPLFDKNAAKLKIRSMRNAYIFENNKVLRSLKSGMSAADVYKPTVPWFQFADRFLKHIVESRNTHNNLEPPGQEDSENQEEPGFNDEETGPDVSFLEESSGSQSVPAPPQKRKRAPTHQNTSERLCSNPNTFAQAVQSLQQLAEQTNKRSIFELFSQTVCSYLESMPLELSMECQTEILSYLVKQKKKSLTNSSSAASSSGQSDSTYNIIIDAWENSD